MPISSGFFGSKGMGDLAVNASNYRLTPGLSIADQRVLFHSRHPNPAVTDRRIEVVLQSRMGVFELRESLCPTQHYRLVRG